MFIRDIGRGVQDFLSPGGNPADAGMGYLDQIEGTIKPYYDPYIKQGRTAMDDLWKQYDILINDPGSIISRLGKGYTESPGFNFEKTQGLNAINNAAAAGGMMGTMGHQQQAGELSTQLANKDFGEYLRQAMGLYGTGISGKEKVSDRGFSASTGLADRLAQILSGKADYAYEGAAAKNKQMMDLLGMLVSGGTALATGGMGGGGGAMSRFMR